MTTEILNKNLAILDTLHPNAYEAVKNSKPSTVYEITSSQSGAPTLSYIKPNKTKIYLLSNYEPFREAKRFIDSLGVADFTNFIVIGIGLGYQLIELVNSIPKQSKIIVIENDADLARLAFETNDLSQVLSYPGLTLNFPNDPKEITTFLEGEKSNFTLNGYQIVQQNSLSQVDPKGFNEVLAEISKFFQASSIELKTRSVKSKIFSINIYKNLKNLLGSPGIKILKNSFSNLPAIICSAGPSLDKNIQLLKSKRENFILISVATGLKSLLKNQISPDFVIAIDPDEITTHFFNLQESLSDTFLVYNPVIPDVIPTSFTGKRFAYDSSIKLAEWIQKHKGGNGSLGNVFSVAHAAYQLAKFMGCSPIIFIGQDLSFDKKRLHSKSSYYYQQKEDQIGKLKTMKFLDNQKYQKYSNNVLDRRNIFGRPLATTLSMDTYSQMFATSMDDVVKIFNATEGGMGIKTTKNIQLREAINNHCKKNISIEKNGVLNCIQSKPSEVKGIARSANKQFLFFKNLSEQLSTLENKFLKVAIITELNKEEFIREMKSTITNLLENDGATLLLQDYDFSGFSLWQQKSNDILRKKNSAGSTDLIEEEFLRDQEFFITLKRSVKFNMDVFQDLAQIETSI